jgi:hypothetical protein
MNRHLKLWLNDTELQRRGGRYVGVLVAVVPEVVRNRYTTVRQPEPVMKFEDGWQIVPNIGMRRALVEWLGPETDGWIGQRIEVERFRIARVDPATGQTREKWEKRVRVVAREPLRDLTADDIKW